MTLAIVMSESLLALCLLVLVLSARRGQRLNARIRATPLRPIAACAGGRLVALRGTVASGEQGTGRSLSGAETVVWRARVFNESAANDQDTVMAEVSDLRAFWLDDGSGDRALVDPAACDLRIQAIQHGEFSGIRGSRGDVLPNVVVPMSPSVLEWSRQHYPSTPTSRVIVDEETIELGSSAYVLGHARRDGGVLTITNDGGAGLPVLSTLTPEQLTKGTSNRSCALLLTAATLFVLVQAGLSLAWWLT